MSEVYTYSPDKVIIALGSHVVTGYADDSFVNVEPAGDGTTTKIGCDGSVNRSISPNKSFNIKIALLQNSPTNEFLNAQFEKDQNNGDGDFSVIIKDLMGDEQFSSDVAWVTKPAAWGRGKESTNREWEITCGTGKFVNGK
jgi:hypothetical protein